MRSSVPTHLSFVIWHVQFIGSFEQPSLEKYHDQLRAGTDPARPHDSVRLASHGTASVTRLLPRIQLARHLLAEVSKLLPCMRLNDYDALIPWRLRVCEIVQLWQGVSLSHGAVAEDS